MHTTKLLPFLMIPALAIGCAQASEEADSSEAAATTAAPDFTAAVGTVEIQGHHVCTGAVVDLDPNAQAGGSSLAGRQLVLGGECAGALVHGFIGGAVFLTRVAGVLVSTPIIAIDTTLAAAGGLVVGILSNILPGVHALKPFVPGSANVTSASLVAQQDGEQLATRADVEAGSDFHLKTCGNFHWHRPGSIGGHGPVPAVINASIAIVSVGGQLLFAATLDALCAVRTVGHVLTLPLAAAGAVIDAISDIGAGQSIAHFDVVDRVTTVRVMFPAAASEVRLNARGLLSASVDGASCEAWLGACTLRPAGGFAAGSYADVTIDAHGDLFGRPKAVLVSVPR